VRPSRIVAIYVLLVGVLFWVLDAAVESVVMGRGSFLSTLLTDIDPHDLWMRATVLALCGLLGGLLAWHMRRWEQGLKVTGELLRESEERYRGLYESMSEGVAFHELVHDGDGAAIDYRIVDVNPTFETILGIPRGNAVGRLGSELYGADEAPLLDVYAEVVTSGRLTTLETYQEALDRDFHISAFRTPAGGFATVFEDISDRRRAEEELLQRTHDLGKRVKEIRCLYQVARLSGDHGRTLNDVLQDIADVLPVSWQWPEIASAQIEFSDALFQAGTTEGVPVAAQSAEIVVRGETVGRVTVRYHAERAEEDGGPFLTEEQDLIDTVARVIGDTVEHQQAEAERESLARFPSENPSPVLRAREDGAVVYANAAAAALLHKLGSGVGRPAPTEWLEPVGKAMRSGTLRRIEVTIAHQTLILNVAPVSKQGYATIYGMDVTERRAAERALLEIEQRYRTVFENTGAATCLIGAEGTIILANEGFAQLASASREEIEGKLAFLGLCAPHEQERLAAYHYSRRKPEIDAPKRYEFDFVNRDGEVRRVFMHIDMILGTQTSVASLVDVTELRRTQTELQALTEELEERVQRRTTELRAANEELEAFAYSISHDLRAPLRSIDGFSKAVLDDYAECLDETGKSHLDRVRLASQRMGDLIDDILQLSKITRVEMRVDRVDMSALALEIIEELRAVEPERSVEVVIEADMIVDADRRLLEVALRNLLGNAWKFTGRREQARIEFASKPDEDGRAVYCVTDNGAGFDMAYADKLFQPFQRLHRIDEFPGTGVGLATVRRVIRRHGGDVWAEGEVGKGAGFYFSFHDL